MVELKLTPCFSKHSKHVNVPCLSPRAEHRLTLSWLLAALEARAFKLHGGPEAHNAYV